MDACGVDHARALWRRRTRPPSSWSWRLGPAPRARCSRRCGSLQCRRRAASSVSRLCRRESARCSEGRGVGGRWAEPRCGVPAGRQTEGGARPNGVHRPPARRAAPVPVSARLWCEPPRPPPEEPAEGQPAAGGAGRILQCKDPSRRSPSAQPQDLPVAQIPGRAIWWRRY